MKNGIFGVSVVIGSKDMVQASVIAFLLASAAVQALQRLADCFGLAGDFLRRRPEACNRYVVACWVTNSACDFLCS